MAHREWLRRDTKIQARVRPEEFLAFSLHLVEFNFFSLQVKSVQKCQIQRAHFETVNCSLLCLGGLSGLSLAVTVSQATGLWHARLSSVIKNQHYFASYRWKGGIVWY